MLSEIYYPGWRADIGGTEIPVIRCNSILRCLQLPQSGTGQVIEMTFHSAMLFWGSIVSLVTLLLISTGLLWTIRLRRGKTPGYGQQ